MFLKNIFKSTHQHFFISALLRFCICPILIFIPVPLHVLQSKRHLEPVNGDTLGLPLSELRFCDSWLRSVLFLCHESSCTVSSPLAPSLVVVQVVPVVVVAVLVPVTFQFTPERHNSPVGGCNLYRGPFCTVVRGGGSGRTIVGNRDEVPRDDCGSGAACHALIGPHPQVSLRGGGGGGGEARGYPWYPG